MTPQRGPLALPSTDVRPRVIPAIDRPTGLRRPFDRKVERELIRPGIGNARVGGADEMPLLAEVIDCPYTDCRAGVVSCGVGSLAENFYAHRQIAYDLSL